MELSMGNRGVIHWIERKSERQLTAGMEVGKEEPQEHDDWGGTLEIKTGTPSKYSQPSVSGGVKNHGY